MALKEFHPVLKLRSTPAPNQKSSLQTFLIKDTFALPTLLAIGGLAQALMATLLPARYALIPLAFLLSRALINALLFTRLPPGTAFNPLLADIIPGRATAQFPVASANESNPPTPSFGTAPAAQPIIAFHLGIHINHPLGLVAPGARTIGAHFQTMVDALSASPAARAEFGLLSTTTWRGTERASGNSILMVAYFRDAEGLNRFAHSEVHRAGWDWYHKFVRETGYRHFGIFHETFLARPGAWETVYVDCEPTLLGAANVPLVGMAGMADIGGKESEGSGEESWIRPLVSADHPSLKTQLKRMPDAFDAGTATSKKNVVVA